VHVDPDILIVDEALSVGDAHFQAKAMTRIDEILQRGTTLLFVGHDLNAVRSFCRRAILLERGAVVVEASPEEVITEYLFRIHTESLRIRRMTATSSQRLDAGFGDGETCVQRALINGSDEHASLAYAQAVELQLTICLRSGIAAPFLILDINDSKGLQVSGRRISLPHAGAGGMVSLCIRFDAILQRGVYRIRMRVVDAPTIEQTQMLSRQDVLSFDVVDDSRAQFTGLFKLPMEIEVH